MLAPAFVGLAALLGWHLEAEFEDDVLTAQRLLLHNVELIATRQDALVARADALLSALMLSPEVQPGAAPEVCQAVLGARLASDPVFSQIAKADVQGRLDCVAAPRPGFDDVADRAYFRAALGSGQAVVADVITPPTLQTAVMVFAKALRSADGQVQGVLFVWLDLDWLKRELARHRVSSGARLLVIDGQATIAARYPDPEGITGQRGDKSAIMQRVLASSGPGTLEETNLFGERRLVAHAPLLTTAAGSPYRLLLSIPKDDVNAPLRRDALLSFALLLVLLLATAAWVAIGSDRLVLQPLAALARTAARMRAGEPGSRSGLPHGDDPIGTLAKALDASAEAIEDRERRLAAAKEDALRQLAERSEMLDVLAHEVRQPLNNASAAMQAAATVLRGALEPSAKAPLLRAQTVLSDVRASIDNTLAAASLLVGDKRVQRQDTDIDALIAVAIADLGPGDAARVHVERATPTRTAAMDASLMRLALRNLLSNALKCSPAAAGVTVCVADSDTPLALLLDVVDAGPGIDASLLPGLFERDARPAGARTGRRKGLGLYIVRRVMDLHGGSVALVRNGPGGVTMRLTIVQNLADD